MFWVTIDPPAVDSLSTHGACSMYCSHVQGQGEIDAPDNGHGTKASAEFKQDETQTKLSVPEAQIQARPTDRPCILL